MQPLEVQPLEGQPLEVQPCSPSGCNPTQPTVRTQSVIIHHQASTYSSQQPPSLIHTQSHPRPHPRSHPHLHPHLRPHPNPRPRTPEDDDVCLRAGAKGEEGRRRRDEVPSNLPMRPSQCTHTRLNHTGHAFLFFHSSSLRFPSHVNTTVVVVPYYLPTADASMF